MTRLVPESVRVMRLTRMIGGARIEDLDRLARWAGIKPMGPSDYLDVFASRVCAATRRRVDE